MRRIAAVIVGLALLFTGMVVGASSASAHEFQYEQDCRLYSDYTGWFWNVIYDRSFAEHGWIWVEHWHQPKGLNWWGDAHHELSRCHPMRVERI